MSDNNRIELSEAIRALRQELITIKNEGSKKEITFSVKNVEVELETVIEKEVDGQGGFKIKFCVVDVNAEASGKYKAATKQKIKLSLNPKDENSHADDNLEIRDKE